NWCPQGRSVTFGSPDFGSPNLPDRNCEGWEDTDTAEEDPPDGPTPDCLTKAGRNDGLLSAADLCRGELVITEVMIDPLDCQPLLAQYVEVYNPTAFDIDPRNLNLEYRPPGQATWVFSSVLG